MKTSQKSPDTVSKKKLKKEKTTDVPVKNSNPENKHRKINYEEPDFVENDDWYSEPEMDFTNEPEMDFTNENEEEYEEEELL